MSRTLGPPIFVLLIALGIPGGVGAQSAQRQAAILLRPSVGPPTESVTAKGEGFGSNEVVDIYFGSEPLARELADSQGTFTRQVIIPSSALPGTHAVTAIGEQSGFTATATFTVRTNWSRFHFDAEATGLNPFENVLDPSNVSDLQEKWSVPTAADGSPNPVVSGGLVYAASTDGVVRALDPATGATVWAHDVGGSITGLAADVTGGEAVVSDDQGALVALNASTGKQLWADRLGDTTIGAPTVSGGEVFGIGQKNGEGGAVYPFVYAADAATGKVLWMSHTSSDSTYVAVANGLVYTVVSFLGGAVARDARSGDVVCSYMICGEVCYEHGSIAAADGLVFLVYDYAVFALDAFTGAYRWEAPSYVVSDGTPAVADGTVYLGADQGLYAWNGKTGALLWKAPLPAGTVSSSPAVANGVVYIGADDGRLRAYDASSGATLWQGPQAARAFAGSPAVSDGVLYDGAEDGTVYAFSLPG